MGQLPKLGLDWTTNSILCTPNELLFTGMSEKVWKKGNSQKLEKIWPLWRKITKKSVLTVLKAREKKKTNTKYEKNVLENNDDGDGDGLFFFCFLNISYFFLYFQ